MDQKDLSKILESAAILELRDYAPAWEDTLYSEMTREEAIQVVMYQHEKMRRDAEKMRQDAKEKDELNRSLISVTNLLTESNKKLTERDKENKELKKQLSDMAKLLKETMRKMDDLACELKLNKKNRYGSKSDKRKKGNRKPEPPTHQERKEDFDGTPESIDENSSEEQETAGTTPKEPTQNQREAYIFRHGTTYRTMKADNSILHPSDLSKLPEGAEVLSIVSQYGYELVTKVIEHEYQVVKFKVGNKLYQAYLPSEGEPQYIDRVPGTKASADMLAYLGFSRYVLDTPIYREVMHLRDEKMRVSRMTLTNWLYKGSEFLSNIVEQLKETALVKDSILNCDETWCRVLVEGGYRKRYIWCLVNKAAKIVIYYYEDGSRSRDVLKHIIGNSQIKALQSDGYNVYMYLDKQLTDVEHLCCLAHARAKFNYAATQGGDKDAEYMLDCIAELYALEATYKKAGLGAEDIQKARNNTKTLEIIGRIRSKLNVLTAADHPPRGELMEKAVRYLQNLWDQIFAYRKDGRYSIDNTLAEQYIRPLAGERKNSLFFGSHKMARASAIYHTVISTCKAMGLSALEYMRKFFRCIVEGRRDYPNLTPMRIGINVNNL